MARFPVTGVFGDGAGGIVRSGTVAVVLYGTSTPAVIYAAQAGGVGVGSVLSDGSGKYEFWIDDGDYDQTQVFEARFSKSGGVGVGTNILVSYAFTLAGLPIAVPAITDFTDSQHDHADAAGGGSTLNSPTIVTPVIVSFAGATHNHGSAAGGGSSLSSPVIVTPTIASFVNAGHDHQNAAGGGSTLTSPTVVTPTIADFTNANHNHSDAASGGVVSAASSVPYIRLHDSKASTVHGGTFTQGAWQKRTVTEDQDTDNNCSVTDSEITLEAGTYECLIRCPAYTVGNHQARLRNTSDNDTAVLGSNARSDLVSPGENDSVIQGLFTIAAQKIFQIQQRCQQTKTTSGFGLANSFGENELYTAGEFWKVAE